MDGVVKIGAEQETGSFRFEERIRHPSVPRASACGHSLLILDVDDRAVFYDFMGGRLTEVDLSDSGGGFGAATFNPTGDVVGMSALHQLLLFTYKEETNAWTRVLEQSIERLYAAPCIDWKPDGSKIVAGTMTGGVELFDVYLRRYIHKSAFEFTHISHSSSVEGFEILRTRIYQDKFIVAHTPGTLLLGHLESCFLSEIEWHNPTDQPERFYFDNDQGCLIYCDGEIHVVQFGRNDVCGIFSAAYLNPYGVSFVMSEGFQRLAYLLDAKTLHVHDLILQQDLASLEHQYRIDWLELNATGSHLLFRDKRGSLFLYSVSNAEAVEARGKGSVVLLERCRYAQWVPSSEAIVAQNDRQLYVWYNIDSLEAKEVMNDLGGARVEGIERTDHKTVVILRDAAGAQTLQLDEGSLERRAFATCIALLKKTSLDGETLQQWRRVAEAALDSAAFRLSDSKEAAIQSALECYEAIGHASRVAYLNEVVVCAESAEEGYSSTEVLLRVLLLNQEWKQVEALLTQRSDGLDRLITIYKRLEKWPDALRHTPILFGRLHQMKLLNRVAEKQGQNTRQQLQQEYIDRLLNTQQGKAGEIKEREGDFAGAVSLYVNGGYPLRAADTILHSNAYLDENLIASLLAVLERDAHHEAAGDLLKHLQRYPEAQSMYQRARCFQKLAEVCRQHDPAALVDVECQWGDALFSTGHYEAATERYVQAGQTQKAIKSALLSKNLTQAAELLNGLEGGAFCEEHLELAEALKNQKQWKQAEEHFINGQSPMAAIEMYQCLGQWDAAQHLVQSHIPSLDQTAYYLNLAAECELLQDFDKAEKAYLCVEGGVHAVVDMYKKHKQHSALLRFVKANQEDALSEVYQYIGHELQLDKKWREAEKYYLCCEDWKSVITMYKSAEMWEDAIRVAKSHSNDPSAYNEVVYELALRKEFALLERLQAIDGAIDYALQLGAFREAREIAKSIAKERIPEIHLRQAMALEDDGAFLEAEEHFVQAGKPQEAVDMHVHAQQWQCALELAGRYLPTLIPDIYIKQAESCSEVGDYRSAEELYIKAKCPELAVTLYLEAERFEDALRVAETSIPSLLPEVHLAMASRIEPSRSDGPRGSNSEEQLEALLKKAQAYQKGFHFEAALDVYLSLDSALTHNHDLLQKVWVDAVELCLQHIPERTAEVTAVVASRLMKLKKFHAAADVYRSLGQTKEVVQTYCMGRLFDEALEACGANAKLKEYVQNSRQQQLAESDDIEGLLRHGHVHKAVELLAADREWVRVHELAQQLPEEDRVEYSMRHALEQWEGGNVLEALQICALHGVSRKPEHVSFLHTIANTVLRMEDSPTAENAESRLLTILHHVLGTFPVEEGEVVEWHRQLLPSFVAVRWLVFMRRSTKAELKEVAAKQSLSLLKSIPTVPADKAFYLAGDSCREAGWTNMAMVFSNRYLDIIDAMDEADTTLLDSNDFADAEIGDVAQLPQRHSIDADKRETVRDWVLAKSMDANVSHELTTTPCEACHQLTYIANQYCHHCRVAPLKICRSPQDVFLGRAPTLRRNGSTNTFWREL